ncbi:MAG TPA: FAD-dependent oxidoreductase [Nitrososphaerales archaeon]|nr:FAD-dependent oxidoreductase [Nitrososphaerales archaeon]HUK74181.1 FAD-dependent oxidoreductase [Nitrososphaerales archaeon]
MGAMIKPNRVGPFPFAKADADARKKAFSEVALPYTKEQVMLEADRCLKCGTAVCIDACPVQSDVRGMCEAVSRGDFATAFCRIRETNPLAGTTARCDPQMYSLCEEACALQWGGQPVAIGMIQRFVADYEMKEAKQPDPSVAAPTGKRVAVVGAGPAGLGAASLLRRYGHSVTIYDELPTPGGTAWYGIPDYHLPKDVLLYEIERIRDTGVAIRNGVRVGRDVTLTELLSEGADAVVIATGSKDVVKMDTQGSDLKGVFDGYEFLEDVYVNGVSSYLNKPTYDLGREILVIGGGDSALDAARTALRLTGGHVTIVYRRTEKEMPADPTMVEEAREEGVEFKFLTNPKRFNGQGGRLTGATMTPMRLGAPDASGRRSPEPIADRDFEMACSTVLVAVGRGPNSFIPKEYGLKTGKKNAITVDEHFQTSMSGVFAAGDVTTGESLVVKAMAQGREAAQFVHEYLMGLASKHVSLYDRYYTRRTNPRHYNDMFTGKEEGPPPA